MSRASIPVTDSMSRLLADRVAVVTGAGRGNGRAIAISLARAGAAVCVADIEQGNCDRTAEEIIAAGGRALAVKWDVSSASDAAKSADLIRRKLGAVDILVNNAGIEGGGPIGAPDYLESWRRVLGVNLDGAMLVTHTLAEDLRKSAGCIVNVASMMAMVAYQPGASAYCAAKGALVQWTRSLAIEMAPEGVRVNAVAPGFFETAMTEGTRADPVRLAYFESRTPMKRMGQPEELANAVLFLVSPLASYVTGVVLPVDGGLLAN